MDILKFILICFSSFMVMTSGLLKLTGQKKIVESLTLAGMGNYIPYFGIAQIVFAFMFSYPVTRNLGFILLICYFSGALALDLSRENPVTPPLVFLAIIFCAQYLNNPTLFF